MSAAAVPGQRAECPVCGFDVETWDYTRQKGYTVGPCGHYVTAQWMAATDREPELATARARVDELEASVARVLALADRLRDEHAHGFEPANGPKRTCALCFRTGLIEEGIRSILARSDTPPPTPVREGEQ